MPVLNCVHNYPSDETIFLLYRFVIYANNAGKSPFFCGPKGEKDEPDAAEGAAEGARAEPAGQQERPHIEAPRLGKDQPGLIDSFHGWID